ncbi:MAG TPA: KUP/HAK/KT family potassium transporter, partial [Polyangiaceae bacterium]|nr:KUP/HAK/KT family potassium transporter [Polyangiaceae bacterium]
MSDPVGARSGGDPPSKFSPQKPALSIGPPPTARPPDSMALSRAFGHGEPGHAPKSAGYVAKLAIAALGVVFGDIGTSPLYSMRECFHGTHGIPITHASVLGILSLIFWSLVLIVAVKYVFYVLRADNKGEGGILSLMALAVSALRGSRLRAFVLACGVFGAALLYGDGAITPAISVLSAVEGLEIATPALKDVVIPLTIAILVGLFFIQKRGTAMVGAVFGPITLVWFFVIAALGIYRLNGHLAVLGAVNP